MLYTDLCRRGFTIFWIFPVSLLVGLVSIQNISLFWPGLVSNSVNESRTTLICPQKRYLDRHPWQSEVIQSFIPTVLVALLALLIPLILLLIAKKAHTITTLSALHDLIMTRYYKFLIVNVLVFFCVGTVAMQSILQSLNNVAGIKLIGIVSASFPSAGPFYVGWRMLYLFSRLSHTEHLAVIFTTAMHAGIELLLRESYISNIILNVLMILGSRGGSHSVQYSCAYSYFFQLPLIMYPSTSRQVTP